MPVDAQLETVDIEAVPILAAGGPFHGKGSPKKGDYFTEEYLKELAANNTLLAGEVKPANKIGHSKAQRLLVNSGLALEDDERPAAGWLENFRVEDVGGVSKLLADIKAVPKTFAKLLQSKAFRTRSVEISKVTAQSGDKKGEKLSVISGLAWLGAKAPAVRTLDDIAALYSGSDEELLAALAADEEVDDDGVVATIDYAEEREMEGQVIWQPEEGFEAMRAQFMEALTAQLAIPSTTPNPFYCRDIAPGKALVCSYQGGTDETWVVPFTRGAQGIEVAPEAQWMKAEQEWVKAAETYADATKPVARTVSATRGDTSLMPTEVKKLSEMPVEQVDALATAFGIEETDEEARRVAVGEALTAAAEPVAPVPAPPAVETPAAAPTGVQLSEEDVAKLRADAALGAAVAAERKVEKRELALSEAIKAGRLAPANIDAFRELFDASPEIAVKTLAELPVNEDLLRVLGADDDVATEGDEDAAYRAYATQAGFINEITLPTGAGS